MVRTAHHPVRKPTVTPLLRPAGDSLCRVTTSGGPL